MFEIKLKQNAQKFTQVFTHLPCLLFSMNTQSLNERSYFQKIFGSGTSNNRTIRYKENLKKQKDELCSTTFNKMFFIIEMISFSVQILKNLHSVIILIGLQYNGGHILIPRFHKVESHLKK